MSQKSRIELGPGLSISRVINGLWQIADIERGGKLNPSDTAGYMQPYVDAGLNTFDMADHYGSAEDIAGAYRQGLKDRNQVELLTKWVPAPGKVNKATIREAMETSLKRLKSEQLDLLQYHAWSYSDPAWLDTLFELQELKQEGLIKHLGVTNFDAAHLRITAASGIDIVSNQVSYSLIDQRASGPMKAVCQQYDIKLLAYGTLAGGFLSDKWLDKAEPELNDRLTWSQMKYKRFIDSAGGWQQYQEMLSAIKSIASKHRVSIANIASCYILQQPHVAAVIIGTRLGQTEHINETAKLLDIQLDKKDLDQIKKAVDRLQAIPGDCGDEYRKPPYLTASGDLSHHLETFPKPYKVIQGKGTRELVVSGTSWEKLAGFCRAVKSGKAVKVSGTTATHGNIKIGGNDLIAEAHFIIDKIEGALLSLGGSLEDVDRTRIYVRNLQDWEVVARVHGERFKHIQPANTLIEARLVGEEYQIEIEAEATFEN